jgi:hypothetical protein
LPARTGSLFCYEVRVLAINYLHWQR